MEGLTLALVMSDMNFRSTVITKDVATGMHEMEFHPGLHDCAREEFKEYLELLLGMCHYRIVELNHISFFKLKIKIEKY